MNKIMLALAGLAVASAPLAASAEPNHGRDGGSWNGGGRDYRGGHDRGDGGAVVAAGLFGLFAGAALSSHHDYDRGYGYDGYNGYEQRCGWTTERYVTRWGQVEYRQVEVCR